MNTLEPKFLGNFDAVSITGGESHFSFISSTGLVYTWGCGEYGQLVRPFSPKRYQQNDVPTRVFVQAEQVFSCGFSTFIITSNQILAAGKNGFGELALGDTNSRYHPVPIPFFTGKKISKIVGGLHHVLFLQKDGVVWASGRNTDGQLGIGSTIETTKVPIKIPFPKGIRIVDVGAGVSSHHSCNMN
jgi:alpha-tubulin suppressor-like RCC1 family protein